VKYLNGSDWTTADFTALIDYIAVQKGLEFITYDQLSYCDFNAGSGTITAYSGPGGALEIPSSIGGKAVTTIANSCFAGNNTLTSVTIPGSVTSIWGSCL
jgi:hypothetical protein